MLKINLWWEVANHRWDKFTNRVAKRFINRVYAAAAVPLAVGIVGIEKTLVIFCEVFERKRTFSWMVCF